MARVAYTRENAEKCWCATCPVQAGSDCARTLDEAARAMDGIPVPERLPGLYCATGRASCQDLQPVSLCNCPACLVWGENELTGNHFCMLGTSE